MDNNKIHQEFNNQLTAFFKKEAAEKEIKGDFFLFFLEKIKEYTLNGGKRLRPISLCKAYELIKGDVDSDILNLSMSVELYHASTLIHDDIMDEDVKRRGEDTVFESVRKYYDLLEITTNSNCLLFNSSKDRFAVTQGILAGNILQIISLKPILESNFTEKKRLECLSLFTNCQKQVNYGQVIDTVLETNETTTEEEYLNMIRDKTGFLFVTSIQMGLILADCDAKIYKQMTDYALLVAQAFQIYDDLMDIDEESQKGHEFGSDIKQGKRTLLIIKAMELASSQDKEFLKKSLAKYDCDIKKCVEIIKESGSYRYSFDLAQQKIDKALEIIQDIPNNSYFNSLANFVINRKI